MAMRYDRLDLNLLIALDVLLAEKSVSLTADRLCLSQSATSSALGRLREYFGDELLVLQGRQMVVTKRGESLIEPIKALLEQVRLTIANPPVFEPSTCDRLIRIMASDYTIEVILEEAIRKMSVSAPFMRFEIQSMNEGPTEAMERNAIDLLVWLHHEVSPDHPSELLFEDDYVVIGDSSNPALQGDLTKEAYMALGHVTARFGKSRAPAYEDNFFRRSKEQRRVEVVTPSFTALPGFVAGTNRVATIHRRLADKLAADPTFVVRDLPFHMPRIREVIQWHVSNNNDAALRWVVENIRHIAGTAESRAVQEPKELPTSEVFPFPSRA